MHHIPPGSAVFLDCLLGCLLKVLAEILFICVPLLVKNVNQHRSFYETCEDTDVHQGLLCVYRILLANKYGFAGCVVCGISILESAYQASHGLYGSPRRPTV